MRKFLNIIYSVFALSALFSEATNASSLDYLSQVPWQSTYKLNKNQLNDGTRAYISSRADILLFKGPNSVNSISGTKPSSGPIPLPQGGFAYLSKPNIHHLIGRRADGSLLFDKDTNVSVFENFLDSAISPQGTIALVDSTNLYTFDSNGNFLGKHDLESGNRLVKTLVGDPSGTFIIMSNLNSSGDYGVKIQEFDSKAMLIGEVDVPHTLVEGSDLVSLGSRQVAFADALYGAAIIVVDMSKNQFSKKQLTSLGGGTDEIDFHIGGSPQALVVVTADKTQTVKAAYFLSPNGSFLKRATLDAGGMAVINAIKELDPVSWDMAESEWVDHERSEGNLIEFDGSNSYYWLHDIENFVTEMKQKGVG